MRLTVDLIRNSLSYLNPLKERELDLRGAFSASVRRLRMVLEEEEEVWKPWRDIMLALVDLHILEELIY